MLPRLPGMHVVFSTDWWHFTAIVVYFFLALFSTIVESGSRLWGGKIDNGPE
jgi:hypothetical protein